MFTKDVAAKLEKREVRRGKDHIQKVKKSFFLFSICKQTHVEKRKRDEGDLALIHGKINHKTSTEVTKRKTFLIDVRITSLSIAQSGRTEANEMLPQQCNSRSKEHISNTQKHGSSKEMCTLRRTERAKRTGKTTTNSKTSERNKRCKRRHNRRRALSDRLLGRLDHPCQWE